MCPRQPTFRSICLMGRGSAWTRHNTSVLPLLLKRCAHCHEEKPITEFCRNVQSRDGLTSYCKGCLAIRRSETRKRHPRPKAPDLRQCEVCKKSYSRSDAGGKTKYCSDDCFRRRRERPPVIELRTCVGLDCGKTFEASSHGQTVKRYCSQECYRQTKSRKNGLRIVACRWCDQPFRRAERGALEMFCSDVCKKAKRRADKRIAGKRCTARSVRATCDSCGLWFRRQSDSRITTCQLCRRGESVKHGLGSTYTNRGCRCQDCTTAVSQERLRNKYKVFESVAVRRARNVHNRQKFAVQLRGRADPGRHRRTQVHLRNAPGLAAAPAAHSSH
jgi:hypothetical protein